MKSYMNELTELALSYERRKQVSEKATNREIERFRSGRQNFLARERRVSISSFRQFSNAARNFTPEGRKISRSEQSGQKDQELDPIIIFRG